ncbi:MAG: nicotinamide mononucleotide transporter [Lentisphaerae bacterium]|nr:nicotinamide mononucleotide transporter [Lentisphaerota bacterium]
MLKKFIIKEFSNWHFLEWLWMLFCIASTVTISLALGDNCFGTTAAVTGVLYTLWAGKGKLSCYFFGIFNSFAYGLISYQATLYGEVLLNWGWYLPMMFVGLFCWRKHLKTEEQEIIKTHLTNPQRLLTAAVALTGTLLLGRVLHNLGDQAPLLDSFTTVLSVTAMVLTVKRCVEQWLLWTIVNIASIYMWYKIYLTGAGSAAVLMMWLLSLANGVIFYIMWQREVNKCPEKQP